MIRKMFFVVAISAIAFGLSTGSAAAATLKIGSQTEVNTLDPHSWNESFTNYFLSNMYEGLVGRGADFSIIPLLAESWEKSNPKTWIFHLRKGVKFHNGDDFTSTDVIFSFNRSRSQRSNFKHVLASVERYRALDDYTVEVTTAQPNPILLNDLLDLMIMDKKWSAEHGALEPVDLASTANPFAGQAENGTGPYKIISHTKGEKSELVAFDRYWGKRGNIEKVIFTPIKNARTLVAALLSGELDLVMPLPLQDIPRVKQDPKLRVISTEEARTMYVGMDQWRDTMVEGNLKDRNPFRDLRVRKAMEYAIDAQLIVDKVMQGHATLATQYIMDKVTGFNPHLKRTPYDLKKAKELLAEAGYPNGFEVALDCTNDRYVNDGEICQAIASMVSRTGIKVRAQAMSKTKLVPKITPPSLNTTFFLLSWAPATMDAVNVFETTLGTRDLAHNIGQWNISGCSQPEADRLWKAAAREMDLKKREEMLQKAMKIMVDNVCLVRLHVQHLIWGARRDLKVVQLPTSEFPLKMFSFETR